MEEETTTSYLNYGNGVQINSDQFQLKAADNLEPFLSKLPWSNTRKQLFRQAYSDIMSKGVTGALVINGEWNIQYNGNDIDLDSKSKKEREMYWAAAEYLKDLMKGLSSVPKKEEEKPTKQVFSNDYFTKQFANYIADKEFGGQNFSRETLWNTFDEADDDGIRGTKNRASKLAFHLKNYADQLKDDDFSFEGSPFSDSVDFRTRVNAAIQALESENPDDDRDALNKIGLDPELWLSTGANDIINGKTRAQLIKERDKQLADLLVAKDKKEASRLAEIDKMAFTGVKRFMTSPSTPQLLATKYRSYEEVVNGLNNYAAKGYSDKDYGDIVGMFDFYKYKLEDLSEDEQRLFSKFPEFQGSLKKLPGVNGFYFDTKTNQVIHAFSQVSQPDTLALYSPEKLEEEKNAELSKAMNTPLSLMEGFSPELKREFEAMAWDLAAFVDPEAITGTAFALRAAQLRELNRPKGWSWEKIFDWGTAGLGGLPVLGDLLSVGKPLWRLATIIKNSTKYLGMLTTALGAVGAINAVPVVYKLLKDPLSLTPQDVQNLAYGLMGLAGGIKTTRAVRAGEQYQAAKKGTQTPEHSVEVKLKDGREAKIKLNDEEAKSVENAYRSAKTNKEGEKAVLEILAVKDKARAAGIDLTEAKISHGAGFIRGNRIARAVMPGRVSNPVLTKMINDPSRPLQFEDHLLTPMNRVRRAVLDRAATPEPSSGQPWYKKLDNFLFGNYIPLQSTTPAAPTAPAAPATPSTPATPTAPKFNRTLPVTKAYDAILHDNFSTNPLKAGEVSYGGKNIKIEKSASGDYIMKVDGALHGSKMKTQLEVLKLIRDFIVNNRRTVDSSGAKVKIDMKEVGKVLQQLKKKGWLKQGGRIENVDITVSEFLKKLKK